MKKLCFSLVAAMLCSSLVAQEATVRYLRITNLDKTEIKVPVADIDSIDFITEFPVVDPFNGHEYVDLGLPSGTLWATCNVAANAPEEYGNYYAWGETQTKVEQDTEDTYKWSTYQYGTEKALTKYNASDKKTAMEIEDDAARANWGGAWRMPTKADWEELNNTTYTTWEWTTLNGVKGYKVSKKNDTNTFIFLPATGILNGTKFEGTGTNGHYWTATIDAPGPSFSYEQYFCGNGRSRPLTPRCLGLAVRPVCQKPVETAE